MSLMVSISGVRGIVGRAVVRVSGGELGDELDVLQRGQARDEVVELEHEPDGARAPPGQRRFVQGAEVRARHAHRAREGLGGAEQGEEQRRPRMRWLIPCFGGWGVESGRINEEEESVRKRQQQWCGSCGSGH